LVPLGKPTNDVLVGD